MGQVVVVDNIDDIDGSVDVAAVGLFSSNSAIQCCTI